ncbi:MAG: hypothetical protein PWP23_953 [Candidatus Sumerlaeota bacterium]|nr:hypothetical protein [Candidatus Sumerlaeota bacterium]
MAAAYSPSGGTVHIDDLVSALNRAIFMRESQQAARAYEEVIDRKKDFVLPANSQFDLARLLELGNEPRMALHAYEQVLLHYPEDPVFAQSLRGAGHLAYRLKSFKKCRAYLEKFLETAPANAERVDAENILGRLPDGKGAPSRKSWEASPAGAPIPSSGGERPTPAPSGSLKVMSTDLYEDSQVQQAGTGAPISLDDVYVEPVTNELDAEEAAREAGAAELRKSRESREEAAPPPAEPAVQPGDHERIPSSGAHRQAPPSDEFFPAPPAGGPGQLPPTAHVELPDEHVEVENPERLVDYDKYGETPPLRISSRDIGRKVNQDQIAIPSPREIPREALPEAAGWGDVMPARTPEEIAREERALQVASDVSRYEPRLAEACAEYVRSEFAILLPMNDDIRVDSVARILRKTEGLSDDEAREAIVQRKGLMREKLTFEETVEFFNKVRRMQQKLSYIRIEPRLLPDMRYDVMQVDVLDPGLRLKTSKGIRKTRWEHIRLISCGRLDREPTVDLFCKETCEHYRLRHPAISFHAIAEEPGEDENQSCKAFLRMLGDVCPEAIVSHTVRNLLSGKTYRPQKFATEDEYRRYNMVLLLTHFGKEVDPQELLDASRAMSASSTGHGPGV